MARIHLEFPADAFRFSTELSVRTTEINAANHLSNEGLIMMMSEARSQFLVHEGVKEIDENGIGIVVTDLACMYQAEAFVRETLRFDCGLQDFNKYGADIVFRITRLQDQRQIALTKCGFVFFDYRASRVAPIPVPLRQHWGI